MDRSLTLRQQIEQFRKLAETLLDLVNWLIENEKHMAICHIDFELIYKRHFDDFMSPT